MHLQLRLHGSHYRTWLRAAHRRRWHRPSAFATVVPESGDGVREYLVAPAAFRLERSVPGRVPVYVRVGDMPPLDRTLPLFPVAALASDLPFLIVDASEPMRPAAVLHTASGKLVRVDDVVLVGAGPYRVPRAPVILPPSAAERRNGPYSRELAAFGDRHDALHALQSAHVAVVGAGRNGSLMATHLASIGVGRGRITLIDDDVLESANLAAMALDPTWAGRRKVDAVATLIERIDPRANVHRIATTARDPEALQAMARSDLIVVATDRRGSNEARLLAAAAGAAFLRPVLEVGTGIQRGARRELRLGADVRLTLDQCLLCMGGLGDIHRDEAAEDRSWRDQRAGSLRSLNSVATGLAQHLLERFFIDPSPQATWIHLELDTRGFMNPRTMRTTESFGGCPLCRMAGLGDEVFTDPARLHEGLRRGARAGRRRRMRTPFAEDADLPF